MTFVQNFPLFSREWVYLHRNLSGKYRVTKLSLSSTLFDHLRSKSDYTHPNGVYVAFGTPTLLSLLDSDSEITDFYIANGNFSANGFEMLSYITGDTKRGDPTPYLTPPEQLPESETQGSPNLDVRGHCLSNIPFPARDYIARRGLEYELEQLLCDDHHLMITLSGRGGIGKTSLALNVLHAIASLTRFDVILWFSARDIDLLASGAKRVSPHVLNIQDVADEFASLISADGSLTGKKERVERLARNLSVPEFGSTLYVFDNFETVTNPSDFFRWLDTYIRAPNKILITTRHREFRGDFPIEVRGMTSDECNKLIDSTADRLGIHTLLTTSYREQLFTESDGHPYVVKMLLGEVAKARRLSKIERIVAGADEILAALFERTYARLSPGAQRVFLTLCNWRAAVPLLALEAVLLRSTEERLDVGDAVAELENLSFIEVTQSPADKQVFIVVPLVTAEFGKRKLSVSPAKTGIEADTQLLYEFGGGQRTDLHRGIEPRIVRMVRYIARRISEGKVTIEEYIPMLELIGRRYPRAWLRVAELYEEAAAADSNIKAQEAVRRFLEQAPRTESIDGWLKLATLCRAAGNILGEVQALVEVSKRSSNMEDLSRAANRLNFVLAERRLLLDAEEKRIIVSQLVDAMEAAINAVDHAADPTDLSRLAWLYLHLGDIDNAARVASKGLTQDKNNEHCMRILERLGR